MEFTSPWTLTTDHPASSYGIPVFVHAGVGHGPRDSISAFVVAEVVHTWAKESDRTDEEKALAGRFLRQWPEGPQLAHVPGVMGRPRKFAKTDLVGIRVETSDLERIPEGVDRVDFIRAAIKEKLARDTP